ncbi:MAG: hypothetical protein PHW52_02220 [Candidatus Pacebacteria bacterium]|nr:hypothetical protein [Candidatus Paceibacterota bacterium]
MSISDVVTFLASDGLNNFLLPFKVLAVLTVLAFMYMSNYYYRKQEFNIMEWRRKYNHFSHQTSPAETKTIPQRFQQVIDLLNKKNQLDTKMALLKNQNLILDILKKLNIPMEKLDDITEEDLPNASAFKLLIDSADKVSRDPSLSVNIEKTRELFILMRDSLLEIGII